MKQIRSIVIGMVCLLLLGVIPQAAADTDQAENLTKKCSFAFDGYPYAVERVLMNPDHYQIFDPNASFSFSTEESLPDARLCLQWCDLPEDVRILQYDASNVLLSQEVLQPCPETVTPIAADARKVVVQAGEKGMQVRTCAVFGAGELPDPFHDWQETPTHLDYLLISTHPDDDVLFLGSVVPMYGAERGYVGTIAYITCVNRERMTEAENGAWAMGLRYRPLFFDMPDIESDAPQSRKDTFSYEELLTLTVRIYRAYRPAVVFAQDENGEYGHWQHKLTSKAAREAFGLAADPGYDPESANMYGVWQVQKLFLHLYEENPIEIDAHTPLSFFGEQDAFHVARRAFKKHRSQQSYGFSVQCDQGKYAFNRFGMAEGVVPVGNDVFDNVDETLLSSYVPPTPAPAAPTQEPTESPTETPEPPQETELPTIETTAPEPTETPMPEPVREPLPFRRMMLFGIGAATIIGALWAVFAAKRRKTNR